MAIAPAFTARHVELIIHSLPDGVDQRRLKLLPKILNEWARADLPLHLSEPSTKTKRERTKRMQAVDGCSRKLMQALDAVDQHDDRFWIMREMIMADGLRLSPTEQTRLKNQFQEMLDFLGKLSSASVASGKIWKQGRGHPRNVAASLVLMDIVAIYEWLTNKKATRQVDRGSNRDTGPFWEFAKAIWPLVFGKSEEGLSAAIRNWADAVKQKRKGTHSPLIVNIAMHHPTWGVFEN